MVTGEQFESITLGQIFSEVGNECLSAKLGKKFSNLCFARLVVFEFQPAINRGSQMLIFVERTFASKPPCVPVVGGQL